MQHIKSAEYRKIWQDMLEKEEINVSNQVYRIVALVVLKEIEKYHVVELIQASTKNLSLYEYVGLALSEPIMVFFPELIQLVMLIARFSQAELSVLYNQYLATIVYYDWRNNQQKKLMGISPATDKLLLDASALNRDNVKTFFDFNLLKPFHSRILESKEQHMIKKSKFRYKTPLLFGPFRKLEQLLSAEQLAVCNNISRGEILRLFSLDCYSICPEQLEKFKSMI